MMSTKQPQTTQFEEYITSSELPVLVDFWAEWCGPCKMMNPIIKKMAKKFSGQINVIKVNTERKPDLAMRYQVQGIPTFILFNNGEPVWRKSGAMPEHMFAQELEKQLNQR